MKRIPQMFTVLLLLCSLLVPSVNVFGAQTGQIAISTAAQLQSIQQNLSGHYILANDIDLSGVSFTPIGNEAAPFTGTFDGNGHTIRSLTLTKAGRNIGLFGYVKNASILNLSVDQFQLNIQGEADGVKGGIGVGAIAGRAQDSIITNCFNLGGTVKVEGKNSLYVGGIVGISDNSNLTYCANHATVTGNTQVAGIVGSANSKTATIANCYNNGAITGDTQVGGIVGATTFPNSAATPTSARVEKCFNEGAIQAKTIAGGIVGHANYSPVAHCGNLGTVSATENRAGGICGILISNQVSNCYNNGTIKAGKNSGALFGSIQRNPSFTNCYYTGSGNFYGDTYNVDQVSGAEKVSSVSALASKFNAGQSLWEDQANGPMLLSVKPLKARLTPQQTTKPDAPSDATTTNSYRNPLNDKKLTVTAGFYYSSGSYHGGTDFQASEGTPLYPVQGGKVLFAGVEKLANGKPAQGGNCVLILGNDGYYYYYAHLQSINFDQLQETNASGKKVFRTIDNNTMIGYTGKTSSNPKMPAHLHLTIAVPKGSSLPIPEGSGQYGKGGLEWFGNHQGTTINGVTFLKEKGVL